ncbi:hypothetical protein ACFWUW_04325 [Streptomyces sp. NPDC058655]
MVRMLRTGRLAVAGSAPPGRGRLLDLSQARKVPTADGIDAVRTP